MTAAVVQPELLAHYCGCSFIEPKTASRVGSSSERENTGEDETGRDKQYLYESFFLSFGIEFGLDLLNTATSQDSKLHSFFLRNFSFILLS